MQCEWFVWNYATNMSRFDNACFVAVKRKMKTTTEAQRTQIIAELEKGGKYKISSLLVLSVFSVPLW